MISVLVFFAVCAALWAAVSLYAALTWDRPQRTSDQVWADVEAVRLERFLEQHTQHPELDQQLDDYARRITGLYATEGEK